MTKYGRHQSTAAEIRRGKKKKPQGKNIMSACAVQGGHKNSWVQKRDKELNVVVSSAVGKCLSALRLENPVMMLLTFS